MAFDVSADNIIVTSGGSQGIQLVTEMVVDPGDAVIVEAPSFIGALQTFRNAEAELHEVPLDDHGMQTDKLAEVLAKLNAAGKQPKLIYTIPTFHNPAGVSMPLARRHELIELARQYRVLVLEDDAYSELRFDGERAPFLYELEPGGAGHSGADVFQDSRGRPTAGLSRCARSVGPPAPAPQG